MTIRIVTDSTCDLPKEIAAQYGIAIVPLYINFGLESYLDGMDLSREAFYARLPDCDPPPTTAVPGPRMFLEAYERLADEGATEILSVHIARSLSAVLDTAHLAAREASIPVTVFDSGTLSLGIGFLVRAAAEAAAQGHSMDEIVALTREQSKRTHVFAALDTLEFLRRGGRLNRVMATLGSWLQMKPLLKMHEGNPTTEKIRTSEAAFQRLIVLLKERLPLERVAVVHTHALERAQDLRQKAQHLLPEGKILSVDITPVFGAHLGPGAVGFVCVSESVTCCQCLDRLSHLSAGTERKRHHGETRS
jgi:DegV family protein with EDD domain